MKKIMLLILVIPLISAINSEMIYFLNLKYDGSNIELIKANVIDGFYNINNDEHLPYKLELYSFEKEILFKGYFEIDNNARYETLLDGNFDIKEAEILPFNIGVSLPYFKEGSFIEISKNNERLLDIDVSEFAVICGDKKCQLDERETCLSDCREDIKQNKVLPVWYYLLIGTILIFIIYLIYKKRLRK
ncbi:hypothetical protein HYT56_01530 [Candidatus Woesearchaeota archaeon]|nr:hypothetical protein [Candidatus Woesearchaeota archaeon]